ncbi:MAG: ABC transporter ATP-binding protein/permease [Alistipes sp.]|nr:ABC transporter ATP-binding protein/permease [Alistipes sp.]
MISSVSDIIPRKFRKRTIGVIFTILLRALLNFAGLALLIPILALILDSGNITPQSCLGRIYNSLGFESYDSFTIAVCLGITLFTIAKCLAGLWLYRIERDYIHSLYKYLSERLFVKYHNRGMSFIKGSNSAILARNVNVVCLAFVTGVLKPLASMASELLLLLLLFSAVAVYSPPTALFIVVIFLPTVWLYYRLVRNRLNRYGTEENDAQRRKARTVAETFRGYADIEIGNAFPQMMRRFEDAMRSVIRVRAKNAMVAMLPQIFTEVGLVAGMSALVIVNLRLGSDDLRLLFGILAVAAIRLMPSVRNIMYGWASIRYNLYTTDVLREADIKDDDICYDTSDDRFRFARTIEVRDVSFRFDDAAEDTLHDLSLSIGKGERVGIRGESGVGKTTLFNLLLGFYSPTRGTISIDGEPLTDDNRRKWQNSIGYVSQNVFITDSTIAANIALADDPENIDRQRLEQVLIAADLKHFVDTLPHGVDTSIGEAGNRLSGGQRQRIGIARALYKDCDVLFFDEATSSLDNRTEANINEAIRRLSEHNKQLTIVVIAHRESSLEYCDRIITLTDKKQRSI